MWSNILFTNPVKLKKSLNKFYEENPKWKVDRE